MKAMNLATLEVYKLVSIISATPWGLKPRRKGPNCLAK